MECATWPTEALEVQKKRIESIRKCEDATDFLERLDVVQPKAEPTRNQGNQVRVFVGKIAGYEDDDVDTASAQDAVEGHVLSELRDPDKGGENE